MSLLQRLDEDLKGALKASEKNRVSVLRMAKSAIKNKQIQKGGGLSDDEIVAVLSSMIKQTRDSIEQFTKACRTDLVEKESAELAILLGYVPRQLDAEEIDRFVRDAIKESGVRNVQDMGKLMRILMPRLSGLADGKYVNERVRKLLETGGAGNQNETQGTL